jgi:hypothetical protein
MAGTVPIRQERLLTAEEAALICWMLEHSTAAAASFLPQLAEARVISRCYCGCASVDFSIRGVVPPPSDGIGILADFEYHTDGGHLCGAFVFERAGMLAGLEVWSVDGVSAPSALPAAEQLHPRGAA